MRKKKQRRSSKRKHTKQTSRQDVWEGVRIPLFSTPEEAEKEKIKLMTSLLVGETSGPNGESGWFPEEDEEWVVYFEKRIQELEAFLEELQDLPDEELH